MKRIIILLAVAAALCSCGGPSTLYYWGGVQNGTTTYEHLTYKDYKTQSPEAICQLICAYEDMVLHPGGTRAVPPPGICAEYGYLLLQPNTAVAFSEKATAGQRRYFSGTDYATLFYEHGKEMLQKELEYYPESRQFIEPLIKKLAQ